MISRTALLEKSDVSTTYLPHTHEQSRPTFEAAAMATTSGPESHVYRRLLAGIIFAHLQIDNNTGCRARGRGSRAPCTRCQIRPTLTNAHDSVAGADRRLQAHRSQVQQEKAGRKDGEIPKTTHETALASLVREAGGVCVRRWVGVS